VETLDDVSVTSRPCMSQFADGHCNVDCDSEQTQFDGFDCINSPAAAAAAADGGDGGGGGAGGGGGDAVAECDDDTRRSKTASRRSQCSLVYADGTCDHDCDTAECMWDGGDCIGTALR